MTQLSRLPFIHIGWSNVRYWMIWIISIWHHWWASFHYFFVRHSLPSSTKLGKKGVFFIIRKIIPLRIKIEIIKKAH